MPPHDQVVKLLEWNSQVIKEVTLDEIITLIEQTVEESRFYIKGVLRRNFR